MSDDHRAGLQAAVSEAGRVAERAYKDRNPEATGLRVKAEIAAYKPRSREVRGVASRAVAMFLREPETLALSNAALAERLGRLVGVKLPANILTEQFTTRQVDQVQEHLKLFRRSIDLEVHNTPSKVKQALKAYGKADKADLTCEITVTFSDDVVTVGDRAYPIYRSGGTPRINVGARKLNVDALKALLVENS